MKKTSWLIMTYAVVFALFLATAQLINRTATVWSEQAPINNRKCVIIDAGHGGVDGGATSCSGVLESQINLEIALKLNDLIHLLGMDTYMIRSDDRSVYTEGESIAAKKVSDLNERVRIVNQADNAILISIHQNYFPDAQYHGAQVFYGSHSDSQAFALSMQKELIANLNSGSNRNIKTGQGIYLLEKSTLPAILIECGFLSNPVEEAKLRNNTYQQKLCCVIASVCSRYLQSSIA